MIKYSLFLLFLFNALVFKAQVIINEYSCSNINGIVDNFGNNSDWVELYNTSAAPVDLTGFHLSDKSSNMTKWPIPSGTVPANGYLMVFCSGKNTVTGGELHPNFKLTQTENEWIILANATGQNVDSIKIVHLTKQDHSVGRSSNGASDWRLFLNPTPNAANNGGINFYTPTPTFNVNSGFYTTNQSVSITCSNPTATIRYTTDGSVPIASSTLYAGPVTISATTVLRAVAFSSDEPSFICSGTYFMNVNHSVPVISIAGEEVENLIDLGDWVEPQGFFEYFESNQTFISRGEGEFNKHGNDSWAYDQRGFDFIMRDQFGYNDDIEHQIFPEKTRDEFQKLIIKAAANDNYPFENGAHIRDAYVHTLSQKAGLKMDERTWKPCVLYINGQYWGVYDIREKVDDDDFTDYYFNQDENNLYYLKTWGGTWEEYGTPNALNDWNTFLNFVQTNNMGDAANFTLVDDQYNWKSLIDYFVLNSYIVSQDWLNWNTSWWKGLNPAGNHKKWRYTLWDMDATFGHYINYTGIPDTGPTADPCNAENLPDPGEQGHTVILSKLLNENTTVSQYYITRYADLLNTHLSCDYMIFLLDSMILQIQPEMQMQVNRWGGSMQTWQNNVESLRNFINTRCASLSQGLIDCYNLNGPYQFNVDVTPPLSGTVQVNSILAPTYPWATSYFGGIENLLYAYAASGYVFDFWEFSNGTLTNPIIEDTNGINISSNVSIIAHFKIDDTDLDNDDDGINDTDEVILGTDPNNPDTDGDGLPDGTEVTNLSNPLDVCSPNPIAATCDADADGLSNGDEQTLGTNPNDTDSDNDDLSDFEEVEGGSNPLDPCDPLPSLQECIEKEIVVSGVNVPTAFSPNGDGKNEKLNLIVGKDVQSYKFTIFDRWGNSMFTSTEPSNVWRGNFNEKPVNAGIYAYMLEVVFINGNVEKKSGNITLIR